MPPSSARCSRARPRSERLRRLPALALALVLLVPGALAPNAVSAQEGTSAVLVMPSCVPLWWDEAALRGALAVELRAAEITPVTDEDALGRALSLRIELDVERRGADGCAESATIVVRLRDAEGTAARALDLADVPSQARARAIAMAVGALVLGPREPPPEAPRRPAELGSPAATEPEASARAAEARDGAAGGAADATTSRDADRDGVSTPHEAAPIEPLVAIELGGTLALAPASATPWGGPRAGIVLRALRPLALHAAIDALFAGQGDPLGEVRGTWVAGSLGAGLEAIVGPARIGGRVGLGVGWARLEGVARDASTVALASDEATVTIDVALRGVLEVVRELAILLELEARMVALGLDARSPSGSVIALRDAILGVRLGIEIRP